MTSWTDLIGPAVVAERDGVPVIGSLIAGRGVAAEHELDPRISPATGTVLFHGGDKGEGGVEDALATARAAFDDGPWGRATGRDRGRVLARTAMLLEQRAERFAEMLVLETGKPIREARGEVAATVNAFEYFAGLARDLNGRTLRDISPDLFAFTVREPAGVAGLIIPWNFPLAILGQKLPPALAAGCTVVVKPSPLTPLSTLAVAALLSEAGLDPGVMSVVVADGAAGAALVAHPDSDVISFTGSTGTGRRIAAAAGSQRLKRVAMEAGGKTPVIVTRNADLDEAVEGLLFASFFNQGQVCVAGSRILADARIAEELTSRMAARASTMRLGDPYDAATEMGPLVSAAHYEGVLAGVGKAVSQGATLVSGGAPAEVAGTAAAPFLSPTVLWSEEDTNHGVREELFGPVVVVQPYEDVVDVARRANRSSFGLAASVWTTDLDEALDLTFALRTGTVWVNGSTDAFPELPLGGRRDSGYAAEFGREGLEFFTELKTVQMRRAAAPAWYAR
ncbi:aldehyde dehydrogenase family protein [Actinoplanes solisilvae]|uniref:aldehyde dehydrogenase family protein n=1 Tax=Actinoplanes solisilvae TaxID=2486853 RepID=UPI000FD85E8A|nr:aldehyde dehydrogenase family protein [Actinoplanes solisilvae]